MFTKILIANRGAIAHRIERTLQKMKIKSVAVYTKADRDSLHVSGADEAVLIGEGPAKDSYLNAELILETAVAAGVQAIHPGYGFLSENVDFAKACAEKGMIFIGPAPEQLELFGLKHSAREMAEKAGVPLPKGTGLLANLEEALTAAGQIGYPVMLKSTAGGGGIGMRICQNAESLCAAYESVKYLAKTNFKDDGIFWKAILPGPGILRFRFSAAVPVRSSLSARGTVLSKGGTKRCWKRPRHQAFLSISGRRCMKRQSDWQNQPVTKMREQLNFYMILRPSSFIFGSEY